MSQEVEPNGRSTVERGLSTARSALRVLTLLTERPDGVRAVEVAQAIGKSVSTAYKLLESLCEEGYAVREPRGGLFRLHHDLYGSDESAAQPSYLAHAVEELHFRSGKRSYLARVQNGGIEIVRVYGRQGVPKMPGLGSRITDAAHAVAIGKVVLSRLPERARRRYAERGLTAFTPATVIAPAQLLAELAEVRRQAYAVEREEFAADFCCVAAPILDADGRFAAAIGVSASTRAFDVERPRLVAIVRDVASKRVPKSRDFSTPTTVRGTTSVSPALPKTHQRSDRESAHHEQVSSEDPSARSDAEARLPGAAVRHRLHV